MNLVLVGVDPGAWPLAPKAPAGSAPELRAASRAARGHGEETAFASTAMGLSAALSVLAPGCDAFGQGGSGHPLPDPRTGEDAQLLSPAACEAISQTLQALGPERLPAPDPEGWGPDPRLETDRDVAAVAHQLDRHGVAHDSVAQMAELAREFVQLKRFYAGVAQRGDGVLVMLG